MAAAALPVTISGGKHAQSSSILSVGSGAFVKTRGLAFQRKTRYRTNRKLSIHAQYKGTLRSTSVDRKEISYMPLCCLRSGRGGSSSILHRDSGADFVAGFVLGGAVVGSLGYIFAPQIRRSLLDEEEYGFKRAKQPNYYDEGLEREKTRETLNEKISQLSSAIDNVSSRLRGGNNLPQVPIETDTEESVV